MPEMQNSALPDRVIHVHERAVHVHERAGWVLVPETPEPPAEPVKPEPRAASLDLSKE